MKNLIKRLLGRHGPFLGAAGAVLAGFEFVLCAVVSTLDVPALFAEVMRSAPPLLRDLIAQYIGGFGPVDLLAFGWNHPIALAAGGAVAVVLASRAVAGEVEAGTLELVLSQPISRGSYFGGQVLFGIAGLAILSLAGAVATFAGERIYGLEALAVRPLTFFALNFFLLQAAWFSVTMLLSVAGREAGRVAFTGFMIALLSYLVQVIAQMWPKAAFLLPYSLNAYFDPRAILESGSVPAKSAAVLGTIAALSLGLAAWRFRRRDIP